MIKHYLKVAFRNLWKYKNQTLVSVIGLAVGFVCFAMSALWIRYEMTYDSFHKNADRMYCVYKPSAITGITRNSTDPLPGYLKSVFPEIANATIVWAGSWKFKYEGVEHKADILSIDSSFFSMFDVKIVEGSMDFPPPVPVENVEGISYVYVESRQYGKVAITREKALQLFGNESPIGKKLEEDLGHTIIEYEICAVVTGLPKRSNYPFDFLRTRRKDMDWSFWTDSNTLVELVPDIDMKTFEKKLYEHEIPQHPGLKNMRLTPLTSIRYKDANIEREVQFQHIIIFAVAGLLLILCTLFNYLTLFVSRFRMRQREFALRTVYGASGRSLFAMLSVEFIISLIVALICGLVLMNIFSSYFLTVSEIRLELQSIYLESVIYIAGIIVIALTAFFLMLVVFKRRTLDSSIRSNKKVFRKTSIVVQLTVSIVFAFCTLIILKQMYHLHNTDLGFAYKNCGVIDGLPLELNDKMKQIPEIKETITGYPPLLPIRGLSFERITDWDGKHADVEYVNIYESHFSEEYAKFHEFKLVEGEFLRDDDITNFLTHTTPVLINESAAKMFGWDKAVGKSLWQNEFVRFVVKGVVKDIYNFSPAIAAKPFYYSRMDRGRSGCIIFKCQEGSWKTCIEKIKKIVEKEYTNMPYSFYSMEEEYNKYLKSENTLLAILTVISFVCMIICVFGFVSMISLTCEERRKEIAIRKINGATIKDILDIFFKEHLTLLAIGALIAFPIGYIIMKPWLENYVIQTEMSAWVYLSILLALIMVIVACVGGRVYKTSRENPVNAINR